VLFPVSINNRTLPYCYYSLYQDAASMLGEKPISGFCFDVGGKNWNLVKCVWQGKVIRKWTGFAKLTCSNMLRIMEICLARPGPIIVSYFALEMGLDLSLWFLYSPIGLFCSFTTVTISTPMKYQMWKCKYESTIDFPKTESSCTLASMLITKALFRYTQKPKTLQDSLSHRILRHMHEVLNIDKKNN